MADIWHRHWFVGLPEKEENKVKLPFWKAAQLKIDNTKCRMCEMKRGTKSEVLTLNATRDIALRQKRKLL